MLSFFLNLATKLSTAIPAGLVICAFLFAGNVLDLCICLGMSRVNLTPGLLDLGFFRLLIFTRSLLNGPMTTSVSGFYVVLTRRSWTPAGRYNVNVLT